jgi:putative transposase
MVGRSCCAPQGWRSSLVIVQPATVLAWHRHGFQLYWRWKSGPHAVGRPPLDAALRHLIRRMARENPTWGRRRIRAELALLGYAVADLTIAKYMHRTSPRPSPPWRAFLTAHAREIVGVDFFLVPTLTFRLLFVFVVLRHDPPRTAPPQRDGSPHGRLDRPAAYRGVPGRFGSPVPAP